MQAAGPVRINRSGAVMQVIIDNPPVNALSRAVRAGLLDAFDRAEAEPGVAALVLSGAGRGFIAGADIREFGSPPQAPLLPEVCARIEASPLLTVAALHGACLGGGLEVALCADCRIARPDAVLGLPEVTLGLIPGAGGTQRLPRLTGMVEAIGIVTTGRRVSGTEAERLGIVDMLFDGPAEVAGLAQAEALLADGARKRRLRAAPPPTPVDWAEAGAAVADRARGRSAPPAALRALRAASEMPFDAGLAEEREIFMELMQGDQRQALVHAFLAERAAGRLPELAGIDPRPLHRAAVVGGGTMGTGIATALLLADLPVTLVETGSEAVEAAHGRIAANLAEAVRRGKLSQAARDAALRDRLALVQDVGALGSVDLVVEAVFEDLDVKREVFGMLGRVCKPGAVLASNTSYLDLDEIAVATARPADVIGLHFFSPAHVMKLLEIVVPRAAAPDAVATGFALARRLGKCAVRAGNAEGFIGNRILAACREAADHMVLEGAEPWQVDSALEEFGFAMGPYAVADLAGLDIGWAYRQRVAPRRDPRARTARFPDRLCEAGHFGRKTGSGYYLYGADVEGRVPNPEAQFLIAEERAAQQAPRRVFSAERIVRRYMAAMVNAAAGVIDAGTARRPLDVDVVMLAGYGFPRHRGGPCKWADLSGLDGVLEEIAALAETDALFWRPAPLLRRLVAERRRFEDLNGVKPV